jgi:hypothetical protein
MNLSLPLCLYSEPSLYCLRTFNIKSSHSLKNDRNQATDQECPFLPRTIKRMKSNEEELYSIKLRQLSPRLP